MWKVFVIVVCFLKISLNSLGVEDDAKAPAIPLSPQDEKVYHDFLEQYYGGSLNGERCGRDIRAQPDEGYFSGCMRGFAHLPVSQRLHRIDQEFARANHLRVVDPKDHQLKDPEDSMQSGQSVDSSVEDGFSNGILYLSQVLCASDGRWAALRYGFTCGRLCGSSETVVLEKQRVSGNVRILLWIRNQLARYSAISINTSARL